MPWYSFPPPRSLLQESLIETKTQRKPSYTYCSKSPRKKGERHIAPSLLLLSKAFFLLYFFFAFFMAAKGKRGKKKKGWGSWSFLSSMLLLAKTISLPSPRCLLQKEERRKKSFLSVDGMVCCICCCRGDKVKGRKKEGGENGNGIATTGKRNVLGGEKESRRCFQIWVLF